MNNKINVNIFILYFTLIYANSNAIKSDKKYDPSEEKKVPVKIKLLGDLATPHPDSGIDLGFVPKQVYYQVRRYDTKKRVPQSEALKEASTKEEIINAPRLREVLTHKKTQEVYEEQGYEDAGYDHGGSAKHKQEHEKIIEDHKIPINKYYKPIEITKESEDNDNENIYEEERKENHLKDKTNHNNYKSIKYSKYKQPKEEQTNENPNIESIINTELDVIDNIDVDNHGKIKKKNRKSDNENIEDDHYIPAYTNNNHEKILKKCENNERKNTKNNNLRKNNKFNTKNHRINSKNHRKISNNNHKRNQKYISKDKIQNRNDRKRNKKTLNKIKKLEKRIDNKFNSDEINNEYNKNDQIDFDINKYPFYNQLNSNKYTKHSALKYALNPKEIPIKEANKMSFYNSRTHHCDEITPPDVDTPNGEEKNPDNSELHNSNRGKPRMGKLGNAIDCLKRKYFGHDPLDNPFFKENF